jgi:FkbM family methyltransferase
MVQTEHRAMADITYLHDEVGLKATKIDWERLLTINYRAYLRRGCSVIDVGAHHGMHSRRFLRYLRPRHLVLVEPVPEMADGLRREFRRRPEVEVRQVALGETSQQTSFVVNDGYLGESGLLEWRFPRTDGPIRSIDVIMETLDDWNLPFAVDFMKVNVQGCEVDVLRGARKFLSKDRPIVSVEYGEQGYTAYGCDAMTLYHFAVDNDYAVADLFGNILGADEWPLVVDTYYWDYILLPAEIAAATADRRARIRKAAMRSATHPRPYVERWRKRLRR